MKADDIRSPLRGRPVHPPRVHVSNDSSFEVRHPEFILITQTEVIIGIDPGDDTRREHKLYSDPFQVPRIEPFDGTTIERGF